MSFENLRPQRRLNQFHEEAMRSARMMYASAKRFNDLHDLLLAHPLFDTVATQEEKDLLNNTKVLSLSVSAGDPFSVPPVEENPQPI